MFSKKTDSQKIKEPEYEHFVEFIFIKTSGISTKKANIEEAHALIKEMYESFLKDEIFYCQKAGLVISPDNFSHAFYRQRLKEKK